MKRAKLEQSPEHDASSDRGATTGLKQIAGGLLAEAGRAVRLLPTPRSTDGKAAVTLLLSAILIIVFVHWGRPSWLTGARQEGVAAMIGMPVDHRYYGLLPFAHWAVMSLLLRVLAPCLVIWLLFRDSIRDYGFRIVGVTKHAAVYPLLFVVMLPIVYFVSSYAAFQAKYPFYEDAARGWDHFVLYQIAYGIQFVGVEAFFRGFMVFALFKRFGYHGILVMVIPYCMIHFGKPVAEVFAAVPAGIVLGYLALKSRSWVLGAALHWAVAITMDAAAIFRAGGWG